MYRYIISVFFKQQPTSPSAEQLLKPDLLQPGDQFTRVFTGQLTFKIGSDENVLQEVFATFNGEGQPLPDDTNSLSRSMTIGDIICGEGAPAFLVTESGFKRLPFAPRGDQFELTSQLLARNTTTKNDINHPLRSSVKSLDK